MSAAPPPPASPAASPGGAALVQAIGQLMQPLATLALGHGVPYAALDDMLKLALVEAVRAAHPGLPAHRMVSRISAATGINRREVTRLVQVRETSDAPTPRGSPATRVFTRWLGDAALKDAEGRPLPLPRQGDAPSFEALSHSVTRDVHPRSLLDELVRLGLARIDGEDRVHLLRDSFVPGQDRDRMFGFLGSNVGDHLRAAVDNVRTPDAPPHLEQAIFADELSAESVAEFRTQLRAQWKALLEATVPALQALIDADRTAGRVADRRVRVGLYSYDAPMTTALPSTPGASASASPEPPADSAAPRRGRRRAARPDTEK